MKRFILGIFLCNIIYLSYSQSFEKDKTDNYPIYTSLEEALKDPQDVYRFKWKAKMDSLPEEFFQLTNLQELTLVKCRLMVLNERIGELKELRYLNVANNRLVRLPESLGRLKHLETLIVNRNLLGTLPDGIGNLHQLTYIDAWGNPMYELPERISEIQNTLQIIDMRQIALHNDELDKMESLLPHTDIKITSTCDCNDGRDD